MNEALQVLAEQETKKFQVIDEQIAGILSAEVTLDRKFTSLGRLLNMVRDEELWRPEYKSFGAYVLNLCGRFSKGRTQLYNFAGIVRDLSPHVTDKQLFEMGVKKADLLKYCMKQTGLAPTKELIVQACDPSVTLKALRKTCFDAYKMTDVPRDPDMVFCDLSFYANKEENDLIQTMLEAARGAAEIDGTLDDPTNLKKAMLAIAMDFIGSWGNGE